MKKVILISTLIVTILLQSCIDSDNNEIVPAPNKSEIFDFKTNKTISFYLNYNKEGVPIHFNVYSENPYIEDSIDGSVSLDTVMKPIFSAFTDKLGIYKQDELSIPAFVDRLFITSSPLLASGLLNEDGKEDMLEGKGLPLKTDVFKYELSKNRTLNRVVENDEFATRVDIGDDYTKINDHFTALYDSYEEENDIDGVSVRFGAYNTKKSIYGVLDNDEIMQQFMDKINKTLFHWNGSYYSDWNSNIEYVRSSDVVNETILEPAQVNVNFLYTGAGNSSAFAYYYYPSDTTITADYIKGLKKFIVFPRFKRNWPSNKLKARLQYFGKNYDQPGVDEFPAGVTIGWEIITKLLNSANGGLSTSASQNEVQNAIVDAYDADRCIYSNTIANTIITRGNTGYEGSPGPGTIALYDETSNRKVIGFEDLVWTGSFRSSTDTNFTDILFYVTSNPIGAVNNDDIPKLKTDDEDILATETTYGTYAFEDIWPNGGDYDLNDAVIEHWQEVTYNSKNIIKTIQDKFILKHNGAGNANAFGVIFDEDNLGTIDYSQSDNGIIKEEENQFILFVMEESVIGKEIVVLREFSDENFTLENYESKFNPFLVPNYDTSSKFKRNEIHLPLMDASPWISPNIVNSEDDFYYVDKGGKYPFAIELSDVKDWKWNDHERSTIDKFAYPQFTDWAESKGEKNKDWFLNYGLK